MKQNYHQNRQVRKINHPAIKKGIIIRRLAHGSGNMRARQRVLLGIGSVPSKSSMDFPRVSGSLELTILSYVGD